MYCVWGLACHLGVVCKLALLSLVLLVDLLETGHQIACSCLSNVFSTQELPLDTSSHDLFPKLANFIPLPKLPTATETVKVVLSHVFHLHGLCRDIVADEGPPFTSHFCKEFCSIPGPTISLSSGFLLEGKGSPPASCTPGPISCYGLITLSILLFYLPDLTCMIPCLTLGLLPLCLTLFLDNLPVLI